MTQDLQDSIRSNHSTQEAQTAQGNASVQARSASGARAIADCPGCSGFPTNPASHLFMDASRMARYIDGRLRHIMAPVRTILEDLKQLLAPVFGSRLRQVVLYGSVVRGQDSEDSDVDVLLVLQDVPSYAQDMKQALAAVARLARQLDRRISIKPIPLADYRDGDCPLLQSIRREGLAL